MWYSVTGMLEFQIEHHLFPSLPYALQDELRPLVRRTCKEFNVPYFEYSSMTNGVYHHLVYLMKLALDGIVPLKKLTVEKNNPVLTSSVGKSSGGAAHKVE